MRQLAGRGWARSRWVGVIAVWVALAACSDEQSERDVSADGAQATLGEGTWSSEFLGGMQTFLYVPPTEPALAGKRALMVSLHGCSQRPEAIRDDGNWPLTADDYGMVVAVPGAPDGGVLFGCWDYYGSNHTRTNRHNDNLLGLVSALLAKPELNIDPNQVYIAGLSSGASQAMVMGCLAPDVFAGVGLNAGPTVGTGSGDIGRVATTASRARALCERLAGGNQSWFSTQMTSIIYGDNDFTVAPAYNRLNADVMAAIYGASGPTTFSTDTLPGANTRGRGWLWSDGARERVMLIENTGLGHNWPAGGGGTQGVFVVQNSVNYPAALTRFLFENNTRAGATLNLPPQIILSEADANADGAIQVSGRAEDPDGAIAEVTAEVADAAGVVVATPQLSLDAAGGFGFITVPDMDSADLVIRECDDAELVPQPLKRVHDLVLACLEQQRGVVLLEHGEVAVH